MPVACDIPADTFSQVPGLEDAVCPQSEAPGECDHADLKGQGVREAGSMAGADTLSVTLAPRRSVLPYPPPFPPSPPPATRSACWRQGHCCTRPPSCLTGL